MAKVSSPYVVIPIFLNVILLMGLPVFGGAETVRPLVVLAFAFPWILAFTIGRIVDRVLAEQRQRRNMSDNSDFV